MILFATNILDGNLHIENLLSRSAWCGRLFRSALSTTTTIVRLIINVNPLEHSSHSIFVDEIELSSIDGPVCFRYRFVLKR